MASLEASRSHLASVEFQQTLLADRKTKNPQSHVCGFFEKSLEAQAGIEPTYTDLQSAA